MRIFSNIFILVFLTLLGFSLIGQAPIHHRIDTVLPLQEVLIAAPRISGFTPGLKINTFDTLSMRTHLQRDLGELLSDETSLFIKSYGLGSLASSSFRGGSAYHTAVLWNGISLSSPVHGQLDLALIPLIAATEVKVQYGGSSALFGSGAVAGVVHLLNVTQFDKGLNVSLDLTAGSFGDLRERLGLQVSSKKYVASLRLFNATSENNFSYKNIYTPGNEKIKQTNAGLINRGIISENKFSLDKYSTVSLNAWLQHTHRNIPPTMLQNESKTTQVDDAFRISAEWKAEKNMTAFFARAAWLDDKIYFEDPLIGLAEQTRSKQFVTETEMKKTIAKSQFINLGLHNTYATAINLNYSRNPIQNRFALFSSWRYTSLDKNRNLSLSIRQEIAGRRLSPFTWSAGGNIKLNNLMTLRTNVARVYRLPTFNDLYWSPGGDPNLKAEQGYAAEAGIAFSHIKKNLLFTTDITVFNRNISNWILWLPGITYWSPKNILQVWSRGIESEHSLKYKLHKLNITFSGLTTFVRSTNSRTKAPNDNSIGKQLIYTPGFSAMAKIAITYSDWLISYRHNFTGTRFTTTDNSQSLAPFDLGSLYLAYNARFNTTSAGIFFELNNIFNKEYQVIANRAMPGINFNTGVSFQFNQNKKLK